MAKQLKLRRGTTAQHSTFTGASGEVTVDTDKKTLVVHDGTTSGGNPVLSAAAGAVGTTNIAANAVTTAKIADGNMTYAKMQSVSAGKVLGRDTSGAGTVQELPITVSASGNVGIGASSPSNKLEVNGSLYQYNGYAGLGGFNAGGGNTAPANSGTSFSTNISNGNAEVDIWNTNDPASFANTGILFTQRLTSTTRRDLMFLHNNGNLQFNSGYGSLAIAYGCRAWVNFNGTGTVSIRASGNVSSITDYGVGAYGINFSTAMPDTNYATVSTTGRTTNDTVAISSWERASNKTVNNTEINSTFSSAINNGMADYEVFNVAIFR